MTDIVKVISSSMVGAPSLGGANGTLISVMDAALKDGFNLKTIDQITFAGGVGTALVSSGHGYTPNTVVAISGASQAEYNGEKKIISATTTTFTFAVSGAPSSPATGTISAKVAPLGWEKTFSGSNKAAYRSLNPVSDRHYLRIDDSQTSTAHAARVWMAETMTTIDAGGGITPTRNGSYPTTFDQYATWRKATSSGGTNTDWIIIGNDKTFYFVPMWYGSGFQRALYGFGHFYSYVPGDMFKTFLMAEHGDNSNGISAPSYPGQYSEGPAYNSHGSITGHFVIRSYTGAAGQAYFNKVTLGTNAFAVRSGDNTGLAFPNPADFSVVFFPSYIMDSLVEGLNVSVRSLRGVLPGLMAVLNNGAYADNVRVTGALDDPSREFLVVVIGYGSASQGRVGFDLGTW